MAENDELDVVLKNLKEEADWQLLQQAIGEEETSLDQMVEIVRMSGCSVTDGDPRRIYMNMEIRTNYGHTIANIFRTEFEPDYDVIVRATAKKLKIQVKDFHTVEDLEDKILAEIIERTKERIIKEKGTAAWREIEEEVEREIRRKVGSGQLPATEIARFNGIAPGTMMAALLAGRLAGFGLYLVANQVFFAVARTLGFRVGVAVAGPIIGRGLALLIGPAGWILTGALLIFDLGRTNWKKTVSAVVAVAILRKKLAFDAAAEIGG